MVIIEEKKDASTGAETVVVDGEEFLRGEIESNPLDKLNKRGRSYEDVRHLFANDTQFDIFSRLPCDDSVKDKILQACQQQHPTH